MPLHPQAQAVVEGNTWNSVDPDEIGIDALRATMNARLIELAGTGPEVAMVADFAIDSGTAKIPMRVYRPRPSGIPLPAFVYFHSGGYCVYDIDTADAQCRVIANQADCVVVSVGYRLAPEARFPAAVDDAWAALRWVASHSQDIGIDGRTLAVGGESCGGTLATVCALLARDAGKPVLRAAVLSCALLMMGPARVGEMKTLATWMRDQYLRKAEDAVDWRASPMRRPDLVGLPPHLLITGEFDGLREQAYAYAEGLNEAGNRTEIADFPGMIHNFTGMRAALDDADAGLALTARFLREAFAESPGTA